MARGLEENQQTVIPLRFKPPGQIVSVQPDIQILRAGALDKTEYSRFDAHNSRPTFQHFAGIVMSHSDEQQFVLSQFPDAYANYVEEIREYGRATPISPAYWEIEADSFRQLGRKPLGTGDTEDAAWTNAANALRAADSEDGKFEIVDGEDL